MATTNLNIRIDKVIKDQAENIFNELGLNMTTAINMFLRTAIREHGIPFELKLDVPNEVTAAAIAEGRKMINDPSAPKYSNMDDLKSALDQWNTIFNLQISLKRIINSLKNKNLDKLFKVIDVLANDDNYALCIAYMQDNGIKLEQEIISYCIQK